MYKLFVSVCGWTKSYQGGYGSYTAPVVHLYHSVQKEQYIPPVHSCMWYLSCLYSASPQTMVMTKLPHS